MSAANPLGARPLAWGMWQWPLPGSDALTLIWDGPGSGLFLHSASAMRPVRQPVRHPSADGAYKTRKQADAAVAAFIAAGLEGEPS